jgi:SAM-dependent methyltransferase
MITLTPARIIPAEFAEAMKRDWDWRARENAKWFINTFKLEQSDDEFYETGRRDFEGLILNDLSLLTGGGRDPRSLRLLKIGCGIGRMTRHLADLFGEIHAVDVSGEMIRLARERLAASRHVRFYETSGFDFDFPDDHFDLIISAYVFQHVPDASVIGSNIRDAFRTLKPGGIFKFAANGITDPDFLNVPKDTWAGAVFSEEDVRTLAREIGAQLLGVSGGGTQYCWSLVRKRMRAACAVHPQLPVIRKCERVDEPGLPPRAGLSCLTLLLGGLNYEEVDSNNVTVELNERSVIPAYVGFVEGKTDSTGEGRIQINAQIPDDAPGGETSVRIRLSSGVASDSVTITLPPPQLRIPTIHLITNVVDGGVDVFAQGPKSRLRLFVHCLGNQVRSEEFSVQFNGLNLKPVNLVYLPNNAAWEITVQLPADTMAGGNEVAVRIGSVISPCVRLTLK